MSSITIPARSTDQRLEALERANEIRTARKVLKRELKAGQRSPVPILTEPPAWAETMKVYEFLVAMPKVGRVKAQEMLRRAGASPVKTLGGLSARQRAELLGLVNQR